VPKTAENDFYLAKLTVPALNRRIASPIHLRRVCERGENSVSAGHIRMWPSAPAHAIDRTSTIHRCSGSHAHSRCSDTWGHHSTCDRPRAQHDARPHDAAGRITDVLAIDHGTRLFSACGYESGHEYGYRYQESHFRLLQLFLAQELETACQMLNSSVLVRA
jgi:hypothetical protein